jgi:hypothetical protein
MMHRIRKAPGASLKCFPRLALACSAVLLLAAAPALARQCPRGQILRVSKNICVAKGAAFKGHVAKSQTPKGPATKGETIGGRVFYGPTVEGQGKTAPEPEAQSAGLEPAAEADRQPTAVAPRKPKPPGPVLSPYGELSLETFPKP